MNKANLFKWAAIVLLAINLFLVGFMILNKPPKPKTPKERVINKLNLDSEQIKSYETLITEHKREVRKIRKSIILSKKELYQYLKQDSANSDEIEALKSIIGVAYASIETKHFKHFSDIKNICREDQLENFDELTEELSKLFSGPPPRKKRTK